MKKLTVKEIRAAFDALDGVCINGFIDESRRLFDACHAEEKQHRGFMGDFVQCHTADTIGTNDAAKLFAVKRLAEYLRDKSAPRIVDYLHTQRSCFQAAAMAAEFAEEIRKAWTGHDVEALAELNYTEFVKVRREPAELVAI